MIEIALWMYVGGGVSILAVVLMMYPEQIARHRADLGVIKLGIVFLVFVLIWPTVYLDAARKKGGQDGKGNGVARDRDQQR